MLKIIKIGREYTIGKKDKKLHLCGKLQKFFSQREADQERFYIEALGLKPGQKIK